MSKNVVVCCDGTANEFAEDRTNVVKLYATLLHDPGRQVVYYHPGIGTMEHPAALTNVARKLTKLLGLAFGYGLENDIRDLYTFLMRNYQPGDNLYLFGFSRGAYTVRAVASLLYMYGLIREGHEPLVPYAIRMLTAVNSKQKPKNDAAESAFALAGEFRATFCSVECKPYFVGVWDTVASVGWVENPLKLPFTVRNPDIKYARHAVAIDERRAFFRTNLWRPRNAAVSGGPENLKEVWFAGVHCDVGGGYPEKESGLSKYPLEWMIREAEAVGLLVDEQKVAEVLGLAKGGKHVAADANGCLHESLTRAWYAAEFVPKRHYDYQSQKTRRRMNLFRRRTLPAGATIHESAYLRTKDRYNDKLPTDAPRERTLTAAVSASAAGK